MRYPQKFFTRILMCSHSPTCATCCWEWRGSRNGHGYGRLGTTLDGHRYTYAHRLAGYLAYGTHPTAQVCHACDNPPCCNPQHLWQGTMLDNQRDSVHKGRHRHPRRTTLTPAQVQAIRQRWAAGESQRQIAPDYGVSQVTICHILTGRTWKQR
jgi:hypothetical protein